MESPPWEPPLAGTDIEHLIGSLERLRATFRWKADALTVDQLRRRAVPTSELTVGGLLKHLAVCEDDMFSWKMVGRPPTTRLRVGQDQIGAWQFRVEPAETAEAVYNTWEDAVGRSRATLQELLSTGGLDRPGHLEFDGLRPSLRRLLHDIIEEYGRHTGHMDLLREAIDGRTGEDPPPDWPILPPLNDDRSV